MRVVQCDQDGKVVVVSKLFDLPTILPEGMIELVGTMSDQEAFNYARNPTNGEFVFVGAAPSPHLYWSFDQSAWIDRRSLQDLKDAKWLEMKTARDAEINSPLTTPFGSFDADPVARSNITDAIMMLQTLASMEQYPSIDFTLADNTTVSLDVTGMTNVGLLLGQKVQTAHATARTLRSAIDAATTAEELESISWPT